MLISDSHNDFILKLSTKSCHKYLLKCQKQGVKTLVVSVFTTECKNPWEKIEKALNVIKNNKSSVKLLLHIEDLFFIQTKEDLQKLIKIKPFSCGLTWNGKNCMGHGAFSAGGLTKWGEEVIKCLQQNEVLIDLAHANKQTFFNVAKIIKQHIYISHTAFQKFCKTERNISYKQLSLVCKSQGYVGIFVVSKFLGKSKKPFENQFDYANRLGFQNYVGLGSDFYGTKPRFRYNSYKKLKKILNNQKYLSQNFEDFINRMQNKNLAN